MRSLTIALDALPGLRDATLSNDVDLAAAATLAELAGVDAIRLGVNEDLKPVREEDVCETRRAARCFELRMPPSQGSVRVALLARPDSVLLAGEGRDGRSVTRPLDLQGRDVSVAPIVRSLGEAGIPASILDHGLAQLGCRPLDPAPLCLVATHATSASSAPGT